MTQLDFEIIDEPDDEPSGGLAPGEVDVATARVMLEEGFGKLMRQALRWHRRKIRTETLKTAYGIWKEPRRWEAAEERHERQRAFHWQEPSFSAPPQDGAKVTTGGGKSTVARVTAVNQFILEARETEEYFIIAAKPASHHDLLEPRTLEQVAQLRDWLDALALKGMEEEAERIERDLGLIKAPATSHRVFIGVPTHELAYEAKRRMPAGVRCAIYQGRDALKLPAFKEPMCKNLPAVEASLALGADVQKTACKNGNYECAFYSECLYQAMLVECKEADVVFAAHELLFKLPAVLGEFGLVIIDESFWQSGLFGEDADKPIRLNIADLVKELEIYPVLKKVDDPNGGRKKIAVEDEEKTAWLREWLERLQRGLEGKPEGYVQRVYLAEEHLWIDARDTARAEWKRKPELGLRPGDSHKAYKAAVARHGKFAGTIQRRTDMWRAVEHLMCSYVEVGPNADPALGHKEATGWLSIKDADTEAGLVRQLEIMGHRPVDGRLAKLPIIHADATLQLELSRAYLPRLKLAMDIRIGAPHARVTQVIGFAVGKSSLQALPEGKRTPEKEEEVARKRKRLVGTSRELTAGRAGLVITYKAIEGEFKALPGVDTGHHGAIEGIDRWGQAEVEIIIGRPLPKETDLARLAAALTSKPVVTETIKQERLVGGRKVKVRVCDDPDTELVRAGVTEAGVEQAQGRVRAVNRTSSNPVEIYLILHDVVVPGLRIDEVVRFQAIEPGPVEAMRERGWALGSPRDAAALCPDLFSSAGAAKQAYYRKRKGAHSVTPLYKKYTYKATLPSEPPLRFHYKRRGAQQRSCAGTFDPAKVPDPRAALEAAFGEKLEYFEILDVVKPAARRKPRKARPAPAAGSAPGTVTKTPPNATEIPQKTPRGFVPPPVEFVPPLGGFVPPTSRGGRPPSPTATPGALRKRKYRERQRSRTPELPPPEPAVPVEVLDEPRLVLEDGRLVLRWW